MAPASRVPRPATLYALLALLILPVYPHFPSPNEFTRWALVAAVVDYHTVEVSRTAAILGPQFEDLAVVNGRLYSNKAPGVALLAAPGYLLVRPFIGPPSRQNLRPALTAMRWFGATIPLLLLALAMARAAEARGGNGERAATVLLFATPLFAYGLLLFSHAVAGVALFGAWLLLFDDPSPGLQPPSPRFAGRGDSGNPAGRGEGGAQRRMRGEVLAGALIGFAVACEYPMIVPAAILVIGAWRRFPRVALGGAPFAIFLGIYHKLAFGSPFALPIGHDKSPEFLALSHHGLFGLGVPSVEIIFRTLFDPARGLLLFSPVLILFAFARPKVTLILVPLSIFVIYSGYPNWHGGWNVGPRYVVSAIPFLVYPIAFIAERWWVSLLIGMSAATVVPLTLTFPFPDRGFALPWATLAWPLLRDGLVAPNLLHLVWRPLAIIVPFLIVLVALRKRAAGALITIAVSAMAMHPSMTDKLRTGYIEEVYFEQKGAMARFVPQVPPAAEARARRDLTLPPVSWPF
jgi:hypothetical protein